MISAHALNHQIRYIWPQRRHLAKFAYIWVRARFSPSSMKLTSHRQIRYYTLVRPPAHALNERLYIQVLQIKALLIFDVAQIHSFARPGVPNKTLYGSFLSRTSEEQFLILT